MEACSIANAIQKHLDNFTWIIRKDILVHVVRHGIISIEEQNQLSSPRTANFSEEFMRILLNKSEANLYKFSRILKKNGPGLPGEGHERLFDVIKDACDEYRCTDSTRETVSTSKKCKTEVLEGYPYDVTEVNESLSKGGQFWTFKLQKETGYDEIVSVGFLLDKQPMVQKCEEMEGLQIKTFSREKDGIVYLNKHTAIKQTDVFHEFCRKIYPLSEARDRHFGSIIDIEVKVMDCQNDPVTITTVKGQEMRMKDVLIADAGQHMWFEVWETRKRRLDGLFAKHHNYRIRKCRVAVLNDLKLIQTIEETTIEEIVTIIEPQSLDSKQWQIQLDNRVREVCGSISNCKLGNIHDYRGCPDCKGKTMEDEEDREKYKCNVCHNYGLTSGLENIRIVTPTLCIDNGKKKPVTLYSTAYRGQNCLATVLQNNSEDLEYAAMDKRDIVKMIISKQKWRLRITPKGNVISVEKVI